MALIRREKATRPVEERRQGRSREDLFEQLGSQDESERRWAARDLAECSGVSGALCRRLEIESKPAVRAALFSSLTKIGDAEAVSGLIALLHSEDAELRNAGIDALKCLPEQVGAHMDAMLHDDDPDVRIFSVNILESLPHPDVPRWLCRVIEEETEVNVCAAALDVLADLGDSDMIPALLTLKERFADTPYIVFAVDLTVERIDRSGIVELPA